MEQFKLEPCIFLTMANDKISPMVRVHTDDIIVSGESDVGHELFSELK